jgi:hypothetical protein
MPKLRSLTISLLTCLLVLPLLAASASASRGQVTYFEASNELLNPTKRAKAFEQLQALGVHALRVELYWASVAPGATSATKPKFNATDPAAYNFSEYDPVLLEAARLHWPVLLTVTSPAPRWATSNRKAPYVTRPRAKDFEEFMTAVGHRYNSLVSAY